MADNWLRQTHPDYPEAARRAKFIWDHYSGEALEVARRALDRREGANVAESIMKGAEADRPKQIPYVPKRAQGETDAAYAERLAISRFPTHMAKAVGTMVGGIMMVEDKADRKWGDENGLGDPKEDGTFMNEFVRDCDGEGSNLSVKEVEASTNLVAEHHLWYLVDPPSGPGRLPKIIFFNTVDVLDHVEQDGRLVEVKVRETEDQRTTVKSKREEGAFEDRYVIYTLDGYERYREGKDGQAELIADKSGKWAMPFFVTPRRERRRLPIGRVKVPLKMNAGYLLAQGNNYLFNLLSDVRNILRVANFPRLKGEELTTQERDTTLEQMEKGWNVLFGKWGYISPDSSNAEVAYGIYLKEVRDYFVSAFQNYEEAALARTATEILNEDNRGRRSFMSVLADTLDEAENDWFFLLSQIRFPNRPKNWLDASIKRSYDFKPLDPEATADRIMRELFPGGIEWPVEVSVELWKRVLDGYGGVDIEDLDKKLKEAAGIAAITKRQAAAENADLNGLPA